MGWDGLGRRYSNWRKAVVALGQLDLQSEINEEIEKITFSGCLSTLVGYPYQLRRKSKTPRQRNDCHGLGKKSPGQVNDVKQ